MAKSTGLGANFYLDGVDLSGDTNSLGTISQAVNPIEVTGLDKSAVERLPGRLDGTIDFTSYFNPTNAHPALSTRPRGDRILTFWHRPQLGALSAAMVAKQLNYDPTREAEGGLTVAVQALANAWWLDWCVGVTPGKRTDTTGTTGTGVDFGNPAPQSYAFGMQAYLHVFAFTGTSATVTIQASNDNGVGDPYAAVSGGAFAAVTTANTAQRLANARNAAMKRWLRVVTTGTFTNLQFAVSVCLNRTDRTI